MCVCVYVCVCVSECVSECVCQCVCECGCVYICGCILLSYNFLRQSAVGDTRGVYLFVCMYLLFATCAHPQLIT